MTTTTTPTPNIDVLNAQNSALTAQLTALDANRDAAAATANANYLQRKNQLLTQQANVQAQIAKLTPAPTTDAPAQ